MYQGCNLHLVPVNCCQKILVPHYLSLQMNHPDCHFPQTADHQGSGIEFLNSGLGCRLHCPDLSYLAGNLLTGEHHRPVSEIESPALNFGG